MDVRGVTTPSTLPHCLKSVGGAPTRRTGRKPKYARSTDGAFRPAHRAHAPDAAPSSTEIHQNPPSPPEADPDAPLNGANP